MFRFFPIFLTEMRAEIRETITTRYSTAELCRLNEFKAIFQIKNLEFFSYYTIELENITNWKF